MSMGCTSTRPRPDSWLVDCPFSLWPPWRHIWGNEWATYQSAIRTLACINMLIFLHNLGNSPIKCFKLVTATNLTIKSTALQNGKTWTKKFCYFWTDTTEHTATDHARPITDTDSVLCTHEDLWLVWVWRSRTALVSINKVKLRLARLVLGW